MKFFEWIKNLIRKMPQIEQPKPSHDEDIVRLHNGRKALVDARGNFLRFVD